MNEEAKGLKVFTYKFSNESYTGTFPAMDFRDAMDKLRILFPRPERKPGWLEGDDTIRSIEW